MTDENTGLQAPETTKTVTDEVTPNGAGFSEAVPSGKTSKSAIWSLICGICGFLCLPIIPAVILGIIALANINKSKGLLKGTGMAIAGLILAGLWVIAIPFIAIIASIAIPNLLAARISANENSTVAGLKTLCSQETIWKELDIDGNGIRDYWTYDVSCFHRMYNSDGAKAYLIDTSFASADANRAADDVFGTFPAIETWSTGPTQLSSAPKSGYYFRAMELDESGHPYNQDKVGEKKIRTTNSAKFAFVAYPAVYGSSGINTFILNENSTVYKKDTGGQDASKVLNWPGEDPTQQGWQPAD